MRQAYVPSPDSSATDYNDLESSFANGRPEHRVISKQNKPGRVLLYIVVGIVAFIGVCVVLVIIIVVSYRLVVVLMLLS